ncbi:MAG: hypothetical protein HY800_06620, partial [Ignavibacteriales bacterium]|nr:hypothetical protein [Ignavibacteriales bacterium]
MLKNRAVPFLFLLITIFGAPTSAYAHDPAGMGRTIEQDLLKQFKKIDYWANYSEDDDKVDKYDSLEKANKVFRKSLLQYTSKYPSTIDFDFKDLKKEGLFIATSDDGLFRIYSWDTWTGGTMHIFKNVYQYKIGDKVFSKTIGTDDMDPPDPRGFYSDIYSLRSTGKTYYLAVKHAIFSMKDSYQEIKVFSITSSSLDRMFLDDTVKLIKTKSGIRNTLGFSFNFFSVMDREERPVKLIDDDSNARAISIPVVLENGEVTNKSIIYQFTGQ